MVESTLQGFGTDTRKVVLTVGQTADLRISLAVGAVQESVEVVGRGGTVEIETTKSDLSAVVSQEQLSELPVLNRGFVGLAQLLPGGGPARSGDGRFGIATSFGGTNVRSMYSMQIDGGVMDHPIYGFAIVNVSQDAVQEFRVLRNQFDSEYSRAGTAVVNVVTRSGTNDLHRPGVVLRPRRLAQRQERLRHDQAAVRLEPLQRRGRRAAGAQQGVPLRHDGIQPPELGAHHRAARTPTRSPATTTASTTTGPAPKMVQAKADYNANTRHALSVRYLYDNDDIIEDYELAENTALDFQDVSASWNWTLGQSMLNNATVQYMDQDTQRFQTTTDDPGDSPVVHLAAVRPTCRRASRASATPSTTPSSGRPAATRPSSGSAWR